MDKTKIAVIAVVAIIVVAAAAVLLTRDSNNNYSKDAIESELLIYGNANNDYTIDDKDLTVIENIIAGTEKFSDHPLADANNDNVINDKDIDLVKKLINKESATVFVLCYDASGKQTAVCTPYPLKNVVPLTTSANVTVLNMGGVSKCAGYFYSSYPVYEAKLLDTVDLKSPGARQLDDTSWKNFMQLDSSLASEGGVGAIIVDQSNAAITETYRADLVAAGIPELRFGLSEAFEEISSALTIGFLFGGDCERISIEYATISWGITKEIQNKVKNLSADKQKNYICITMGTYICQNDSQFNEAPGYAGGVKYSNVNSEFGAMYAGTGSQKMSSVEALSNFDDADAIISNRSYDIGETSSSMVTLWDKYVKYYENLDNYEDLVYLNNTLPGIAKIAYSAYILYPDMFSQSWANGILEDLIDLFEPYKGYSVKEICPIFTYDMYKEAGGKNL